MAYELTISDPQSTLEASFMPELGMVGTSLRHLGEELLHLGDGPAAYARRGSTFGLPLLYPWANRLSAWQFELAGHRISLDPESPITHRDAATGTPIHGLLAASPHWTVTDADRDTLTAELDFGAVPEYLAAFPFPHRVRYRATVEPPCLNVNLTVIPTGDRPVPVSFGFHPYLTLPGSARHEWDLHLPVLSRPAVDDRKLPTGETAMITPGALDGALGDRTFDTGYDRLGPEAPPIFSVADERRRIEMRHLDRYPVAQVYAPERSEFICFEPMTAPVNALISGDRLSWVAPGEEFTASFAIAVRSR